MRRCTRDFEEVSRPARVAALMTCYNRRDTTIACLHRLMECGLPSNMSLDVIVVDDGSTDGTAASILESFPETTVIKGDGSLFWNRGMYKAFEHALGLDYDFYLWLNDDTQLKMGAIESLLSAYFSVLNDAGDDAIIVGSVSDPTTGAHTYGGLVRTSGFRRLNFAPLMPAEQPEICDAMNGNCVLIPRRVAEKVGNLDWKFEHAMGDYDYALRAKELGFSSWIAPGYLGICKRNQAESFWDRTLPWQARLRSISDRKNLPFKSWAIYTMRHGGFLWPLYFVWPYLKHTLFSR